MSLLLDTHIWLWSLMTPARVAPKVATHLARHADALWLSPISVWELHTLLDKGRLGVRESFPAWLQSADHALPTKQAPLTFEVTRSLGEFRLPHRDPADVLLVATARVYDFTLVTADERLINAKACKILANI